MSHLPDDRADHVDILTAEDHEANRRGQQPRLEPPGDESVEAGTGQAAIETQADQAKYNTIISETIDPTNFLEPPEVELGSSMEWARGLTKSEAQDLLDWLERQGSQGQVQIEANQSFAVHCPGFCVERDAGGQLVVSRRRVPG